MTRKSNAKLAADNAQKISNYISTLKHPKKRDFSKLPLDMAVKLATNIDKNKNTPRQNGFTGYVCIFFGPREANVFAEGLIPPQFEPMIRALIEMGR